MCFVYGCFNLVWPEGCRQNKVVVIFMFNITNNDNNLKNNVYTYRVPKFITVLYEQAIMREKLVFDCSCKHLWRSIIQKKKKKLYRGIHILASMKSVSHRDTTCSTLSLNFLQQCFINEYIDFHQLFKKPYNIALPHTSQLIF